MIVVPNVSEVSILQSALDNGGDIITHLYTNDFTPDADTELADLTELATTGYDPITWIPPTVTSVGGIATAAGSVQFESDTDADVYGWYATVDGELWWAERFLGAPKEVGPTPGDLTVAFEFKLRQGTFT